MRCPWCELPWNDEGHTPFTCVDTAVKHIATLEDEITRLRALVDEGQENENAMVDRIAALVAVGREMADALDRMQGRYFRSELAERWRSLEGKG